LTPQYYEILEILEMIGPMAYKLVLPMIHDVFHVSILKTYVQDVDHVIDWSILYVEPKGEFQP